ncbi:MAG: ABC transporter ATP-binding protein [Clostridiales Family XIII bacterium]|jgi:ABC-type sugar transport system ATPase subunit|nr:ABC transporter ATP-binding protein [Clostridiales Family XIII bacterium]
MGLTIRDLDLYINGQQILYEINLDVKSGELFSILGDNGCGKSTLLRAIAGLAPCSAGTITLDDEIVDSYPPESRNIAMVFKGFRLFPNLSVLENAALPLKIAGYNKTDRLSRASKMIQMMKLDEVTGLRPAEISAIYRGRVAIAQALLTQPALILMDEPFSGLDGPQRTEMRKLIREVHDRFEITTIFVTNDQDDAMMMSDRMAFMLEGEIMQCDKPSQVYNFPATLDIAKYFCNGNTIPGTVKNGRFESGAIILHTPDLPDGSCEAMIRPGIISVALGQGEFEVEHIEYLGDYQRLYVKRNDCSLNFVTGLSGNYKVGDMIDLRIEDGKALFYR